MNTLLRIPRRLTREFIQSHPEWTFVYSTNFWGTQSVGPAKICAGLSNCYGVPVRWKLCKSSGYFQDSDAEKIMNKIDKMIDAIPTDKPIILFPKIGDGHSQMKLFAPKCWSYLTTSLRDIATEVEYV